jgi:hypothetical protein
MRQLSIVCSVLTSLSLGMTAARADDVPELDIQRTCQGIARQASGPAERGGPDLSFNRCIKSELRVRRTVSRRWSAFSRSEKATCLGETRAAGVPSYSDLLVCLEMAKSARNRGFRLPPPIGR